MPKTKYKKFLILAVCLLAIAILIWVSLFMLIRSTAKSLAQEQEALRTESEKEIYVTEVSRDLRETEDLRMGIESFFVKAGEEAFFLEKVETLAAHANLQIKIFNFEKREKVLYLNFQTQGSFSDSYYFLSLIESLPYNLSIVKVLLREAETNGQKTWEGRYEITLLSYLGS